MMSVTPDDWSPADHPYAIAVSEAQWWQRATQLAVLRLREDDDRRISWFSSRQIDARQLVFALRQLLNAERLEQVALSTLGIDAAVGAALSTARQRFTDALPGIKHMRDALMHFDEWSRGEGKFGPQRQRRDAGAALRDVAREYWGFEYDSSRGTISLGLYTISVDAADRAAAELSNAIYLAAHQVDIKNTANLRAKTSDALTSAGIVFNLPEAEVTISSGNDLRIWITLSASARNDIVVIKDLANRIIAALDGSGLHLSSTNMAEAFDPTERLIRGEALYVAS
ncbi:hypothetical protein [Actinoplanes sp. NPDC049316]|uniref:hypothetical protein n=1 Tax=Actinoplanes sp. NPDC049316 TaxID=3154727 RepID=UPI0034353565